MFAVQNVQETEEERKEWMNDFGRTSVDTYKGAIVYIHDLYQLCRWKARWQHRHTDQPQPQLCTASHSRHSLVITGNTNNHILLLLFCINMCTHWWHVNISAVKNASNRQKQRSQRSVSEVSSKVSRQSVESLCPVCFITRVSAVSGFIDLLKRPRKTWPTKSS